MGGWVSVDEMHPSEKGVYLVYANDIVSGWVQVLEFAAAASWRDHIYGGAFDCIVTHWMPLPELPSHG